MEAEGLPILNKEVIKMQQVLDWLKLNFPTIGWSLLVLSIFIQITPIKLNPWSRLFKWIGTVINSDVKKDIEQLNKMFFLVISFS